MHLKQVNMAATLRQTAQLPRTTRIFVLLSRRGRRGGQLNRCHLSAFRFAFSSHPSNLWH